MTLRESSDNATKRQLEDLKGFQKQIEASMKDQVEYLKKTNSVITSALGGARFGEPASSGGLYRENGILKWGPSGTGGS